MSENETVVFTQIVSSETTTYKAKLPKPGRYIASIEVVDELEKSLTKTKPKIIVSKELPFLASAVWNDKVTTDKANLSGSYQAQWIPLQGAKSYKLILKDSDGKIVKEWIQNKTFFKIDGLLPGEYTLLLTGIDQYERTSPNTNQKKIAVANNSEIMAPKLKKMRFK